MSRTVPSTLIDTLKGRKAFEPKNMEKEGFQLISTTFTIKACRKALAEMIIIDNLPFRFVEG